MIIRIIEAFLALFFCYPHYFKEHMKIVKFALNPIGKKLVYTKLVYKPKRRWPLIECISILFWIPIIIAVNLIQLAFSIITAIVTCGYLSKYWESIWRINDMKFYIKTVPENYTEPAPKSKGKYDPNKKCKISLVGFHGKYVCGESNGKAVCNRDWCREWEKFISTPLGNNKVSIKSHHGKFLCAESNGVANCNRDWCKEWETHQVIDCNKDNKFGFKSVHNKYLSAQPNGTLQWNRDKLLGCEEFKVKLG